MDKKGYLLLADGQLYEGVLRGAYKDAAAEMVFTTSVVGYMDTLTDAAYAGQIVVQTFPQIGNYGVVPMPEGTGVPALSGYVCRELCDEPSNFRCEGKLEDYLAAHGIPCLTDVDTRALTRKLRTVGVMNAAILTEKPEDPAAAAAKLANLSVRAAAAGVQEMTPAAAEGKYNVVLWDLGAKGDMVSQLTQRGCAVTLAPAASRAEELMALKPDGVVISGGAGDPADCLAVAGEIRKLCKNRVPVFAVGLGHQLLAMSQGAATVKLLSGHRGANQPLEDLVTGKCYSSSQNHGYVVDSASLPAGAVLRFVNRNDNTCEGVDYQDMPAFSVQFLPAVCGGMQPDGTALGTLFLYDRFIDLMGGN